MNVISKVVKQFSAFNFLLSVLQQSVVLCFNDSLLLAHDPLRTRLLLANGDPVVGFRLGAMSVSMKRAFGWSRGPSGGNMPTPESASLAPRGTSGERVGEMGCHKNLPNATSDLALWLAFALHHSANPAACPYDPVRWNPLNRQFWLPPARGYPPPPHVVWSDFPTDFIFRSSQVTFGHLWSSRQPERRPHPPLSPREERVGRELERGAAQTKLRPLSIWADFCTISASFLRHVWQLAASDFPHASRRFQLYQYQNRKWVKKR
jgi:hypothetical protein